MENIKPDGQSLSNDPQENLRMENEILRLKLKAELGAESHPISGVPAEIENQFLKNVLNFEHAAAGAKQTKVYELLGQPAFKSAANLNDTEIEQALEQMVLTMEQKNIAVEFSGEYDDRTKYLFITEELFEEETGDFLLPGMFRHFCYEEFHPNHKLDIEYRTIEFLTGWFERSLNNDRWELSNTFVLPDRRVLSKAQVAEKFKNIFDCYTAFTNCSYDIANIKFDLLEDPGMGHAEGTMKYTGVLDNGEKVSFEGPFIVYLSLEFDWWSIVYFVLPGFEF